MNEPIIDSHTHLDLIQRHHPHITDWMRENEYVPVSWAYFPRIKDRQDLIDSLRAKADIIRELNQSGLECYFLAGIHPRSIPPGLKAGEVEGILMPFLENPRCLGMGEIGLENGGAIEVEILCAHLALSDHLIDLNKRIGIHTPRNDKPAVTRQTLELLDGFPDIKPITVIDHCTPETIGTVLEQGYWTGVTLSRIKTSPVELAQIVAEHAGQLDKIMCNTDSGAMFFEDLIDYYEDEDFPADVRQALAFENARNFFGTGFRV